MLWKVYEEEDKLIIKNKSFGERKKKRVLEY